MRIRLFLVLSALVSLLLATSLASASSPVGIGNPTMRVTSGANNQTAVIFADGITNGGQAGNGAISFDIYFVVPTTVGIADFSVTAGSVWGAQCPGSFSATKATQGQFLGGNAYLISGFCTNTRTGPAVTGSNVEVATLTFTSSCGTTGTFNVNMSAGPQNDSTDMFDTNNDLYLFADSALTDGGSLCQPTAVTMSGFDASTNNPAPFVPAVWPLLAGGAAVVAGGVYALSRRKR